jgi:curved DNA-binding protein CbpA
VAGTPIKGVSSLDQAPVLNREFDPGGDGEPLTPEDYFVLTRVDGHTSFKQICLMVGFPEAQTIGILAKLREIGALLLPGEPPPQVTGRRLATGTNGPVRPAADAPRVRPRAPQNDPDSPERAPTPVVRRPRSITIDPVALAEVCDLSDEQKKTILQKHAGLVGATLFEILDVDVDADKKALKRAYFRISKEFHPDRFYGKKLGSFAQRLAQIFKAATDAYAVLDDDDKRVAYAARVRAGALLPTGASTPPHGHSAVDTPTAEAQPQSKAERAAELFEAACQHEVTHEVERAFREFAAAIALDPLPRYLRRAVEACLRAQELRSAEEYAKKFAALSPRDAQAHRTLAKVYRALGRHQQALSELELAITVDPQNVHIAAELDEVRRLIGP